MTRICGGAGARRGGRAAAGPGRSPGVAEGPRELQRRYGPARNRYFPVRSRYGPARLALPACCGGAEGARAVRVRRLVSWRLGATACRHPRRARVIAAVLAVLFCSFAADGWAMLPSCAAFASACARRAAALPRRSAAPGCRMSAKRRTRATSSAIAAVEGYAGRLSKVRMRWSCTHRQSEWGLG